MTIEWAPAAIKLLYENKETAAKMIEGGLSTFFGKKTSIAMTGMAGVGKTVLYDYLTGKAFQKNYSLPLQSQRPEKGIVKVKQPRKRLAFNVIPGQPSPERFIAGNELFLKPKTVLNGVIHVVSNGFSTIR